MSAGRTRGRVQLDNAGAQNNRINDPSLLQDMCCNCRRVQPTHLTRRETESCPYRLRIIHIDLQHLAVRNNVRKYAFVDWARYARGDGGRRNASICGQCYQYLQNREANGSSDVPSIWPAYIWSTLSDMDGGLEAWQLLPSNWKEWWLRAVARLR